MLKAIFISCVAFAAFSIAPTASAKGYGQGHKMVSSHVKKHMRRPAQAMPVTYFAQAKLSPRDAKNIARNAIGGAEVIDITFNGRVYRVRMQRKDGRVIDVYVDAATGRVQ